jgi:hypothetical protein
MAPAPTSTITSWHWCTGCRLDQHLGDFKDWRAGNTADQATLRSLLEAHAREFAAWRPLIQNRVNVITALLLSVGLFALAGPEGLRRIGDAVTRGGTLGVDGIVTLVGAAIPLLYPLGRLIFLRPWAKRSVRTARDGPPET